MIKDTVSIRICAGNGGDGRSSMNKGVRKRPNGGNGGWGGNIYVIGSTDYQDLNHIDEDQEIHAENGQKGGFNRSTGADGRNLTIKLPVVTEIYDPNGKLMHVVKTLNEPYLLLKGGEGGLGNAHFKQGVDGSYEFATKGKKGERFNATLKFKLVADIVFIGLPNAGKSSMLNALTNANVKVGAYPFTTLNPHLGRMGTTTLMDLPGLIEGTHEGKGLGPAFAQHTNYSKLVAHFISLESDDLFRDYNIIREELKNIDENLFNKKEVILLTKSDDFTKEQIEEKLQSLASVDVPKIVCSSIDDESLKELKRFFEKELN